MYLSLLDSRQNQVSMALKTLVKVGNITNLSDARYCAGMGVDLLSFPIAESSANRVSPEAFKEITDWVSGPKLVGELSGSSLEEIKTSLLSYDLDAIETDNMDLVESIQLLGKEVIYRLAIEDESDLDKIKSKLSYLDELAKMIVFTCSKEDLFSQIDEKIMYYGGNLRLVKGFGITKESVADLTQFKGLEMMGSPEERPGYKDFGEVMDVLELLEVD